MESKAKQFAGCRMSRRKMIALALGTTVLATPFQVVQAGDTGGAATYVYVGSYTKDPPGGGSNNPVGLSVFKFDPTTGALSPVQQVKSANPSFVALDPSQQHLYVVNEVDDYEGQRSGSAEAYAIDPGSGKLTFLNRQSLRSPIPAHLAVDPSGHHLIVANYIGGNFVVLPIEADGRLGPVSGVLKDSGIGPNAERQEAPHPHSVVFDRAGRFIAAADLGTDTVQTLKLSDGKLERVSVAKVAAGAGPRHLVFSPDGKILYVIDELNATVTALAYDPATGTIGKELQTISTEPAGYRGPHSTAEIAVHPSGKFLYGSNRGAQSIVGYRIDPTTGQLSVVGFADQGVNFPRSFAIDPSGKWLYVANQKADTIVQFAINPETGELTPTGQVAPSITPVSIVFRTAA